MYDENEEFDLCRDQTGRSYFMCYIDGNKP